MKRDCAVSVAFEVFLLSQVKLLQCGIYCNHVLREAVQVEYNTCLPLSASQSDSRHNSELMIFLKALSETASSNVRYHSKCCPFLCD